MFSLQKVSFCDIISLIIINVNNGMGEGNFFKRLFGGSSKRASTPEVIKQQPTPPVPQPEKAPIPDTDVTLPNAEEMMQRLCVVEDNDTLKKDFYPLLLKYAGQTKHPMGVVMLLNMSLMEFGSKCGPVLEGLVSKSAEKYIDALIPDQKAAEEAKAFLKQLGF